MPERSANAHDFQFDVVVFLTGINATHALSQGVAFREKFFRHGLINDDHRRGVGVARLRIGEITALSQRDIHTVEEPRGN